MYTCLYMHISRLVSRDVFGGFDLVIVTKVTLSIAALLQSVGVVHTHTCTCTCTCVCT